MTSNSSLNHSRTESPGTIHPCEMPLRLGLTSPHPRRQLDHVFPDEACGKNAITVQEPTEQLLSMVVGP